MRRAMASTVGNAIEISVASIQLSRDKYLSNKFNILQRRTHSGQPFITDLFHLPRFVQYQRLTWLLI